MTAKVRSFWNGAITEDFLLGGGGVRLPKEHWQLVVSTVASFVRHTVAIDLRLTISVYVYGVCVCIHLPVFHGPPDLGRGGWGASSLGPPRKNSWGGEPPSPQKDGALTSCGGPNGQFLPQNQGKNGQIFPLAPKALAEFLKEPTIVFKLAQICVKKAQKRKNCFRSVHGGAKVSISPQKR